MLPPQQRSAALQLRLRSRIWSGLLLLTLTLWLPY